MDGPELIERVRAAAPGVRALLVSGDTGQDDDLAAGLPFLEKPYTARGLAARVRAVLDDPSVG
jgi:DNA-binding response OmpR family regulator